MSIEVFSEEVEAQILGIILLYPEQLYKVVETVKPDDFFIDTHRTLYNIILSMLEENQRIDPITVKKEILARGLESKVKPEYINELVSIALSPNLIDSLLEQLIKISTYRKIRELIHETKEYIDKMSMDVDEIIDMLERRLLEIRLGRMERTLMHISELVEQERKEIENRANRKSTILGIPTGFRTLDELTSGFLPGQLIVIASRPSVGKTTFALNIHNYVSTYLKIPSVIFSLEMSVQELVQRFISMDSMVEGMKIRTGMLNVDEFSLILEAIGRLKEAPIYIDDVSRTLTEIKAKARRAVREYGAKLITIDYIQIMDIGTETRRKESRQQEIAYMTRSLKNFAKEIGVPFIVLSQLSRKVEDRATKKPQLSDLKESGAIEQDADIVILLHREEESVEYILAKNRNGPQGTGKLIFKGSIFKFIDPESLYESREGDAFGF